MSKDLKSYTGEYVGVSKLDSKAALKLKEKIEEIVGKGDFDRWYEDALVSMIFTGDMVLDFTDVCDYEWTEVDDVNDLFKAQVIHQKGRLL